MMGTWTARADLHADSSAFPIGTLIFTQPDFLGSNVRVTGSLFNLMPNTRYHGFHVHMFALPDGEWNCARAGEHWNPYGTIICTSCSLCTIILNQGKYMAIGTIQLNEGMLVILETSGE